MYATYIWSTTFLYCTRYSSNFLYQVFAENMYKVFLQCKSFSNFFRQKQNTHIKTVTLGFIGIVKPVLRGHPREGQKVAA